MYKHCILCTQYPIVLLFLSHMTVTATVGIAINSTNLLVCVLEMSKTVCSL